MNAGNKAQPHGHKDKRGQANAWKYFHSRQSSSEYTQVHVLLRESNTCPCRAPSKNAGSLTAPRYTKRERNSSLSTIRSATFSTLIIKHNLSARIEMSVHNYLTPFIKSVDCVSCNSDDKFLTLHRKHQNLHRSKGTCTFKIAHHEGRVLINEDLRWARRIATTHFCITLLAGTFIAKALNFQICDSKNHLVITLNAVTFKQAVLNLKIWDGTSWLVAPS